MNEAINKSFEIKKQKQNEQISQDLARTYSEEMEKSIQAQE